MSTLTLVRHAQAHPFQRAGAILTALGEAQAALLARRWMENGVAFDEIYTGALVRQTQTEQVVAKCYHEAGRPWPTARRDAFWNEYDAPGVLALMVPADPRLAELAAEFELARGGPDETRRFQRMFEAAMTCWIEGSLDREGVEPWPAFRGRLSSAIARIMAGLPSRRVVVFTSGGPIGFAVQHALEAPARSFLETHWRVRNTSVTEFVFDRERLTLDSFNCIAHLDDRGLDTHR
jgi:broad specificity phosphatase PhoE